MASLSSRSGGTAPGRLGRASNSSNGETGIPSNAASSASGDTAQKSQNAPGRLLTDKADGRSLREKFNVDTQTGGVSFSIPIQTSPGRSGFGPSLDLVYNSGSADRNSVFGLGWSLAGVNSISRKTAIVIPTYDDDKDTFVHSGMGDLVPVMQPSDEKPVERSDKLGDIDYCVRAYRPRVESDPIRVEYWKCLDGSGKTHWKTMMSGGTIAIFGVDTNSQISSQSQGHDNEEQNLVFSWLLSEIYDSHGNHMVFSYKSEPQDALASANEAEIYENCRNSTSQRYIKSIKYGNKEPNRNAERWTELLPVPRDDPWYWMFEVIFDYGEHLGELPTMQEAPSGWTLRPDPFSSYTSGFEIRTYRRCHRVLMFHHFKELGRQNCLVAATEFKYKVDSKSGASILQTCVPCGYQLDESGKGLSCLRMPPAEFEYWSVPDLTDIPTEEFQLDLAGLSTPTTQWVDLNGDGAPGILTRVSGGGWYYRQNDGSDTPAFGDASLVSSVPSMADSSDWSFEDLTGDGHLDVTFAPSNGNSICGFYGHKGDEKWSNFVPFESYPAAYFATDPAIHKVDLDGNGHADLLRLELQPDNEFTWYPSLGHKGYDTARRTRGAPGLPSGLTSLVILCDMVGDGLSDIVLISNNTICYWPNMGHGRFGSQIIMANAPLLADSTSFSPQRIRMADITGTGAADLIYLPPDGGIQVYYNRFGNSWSNAYNLDSFPALDYLSAVDVLDIGARGTQCLCWTSDYLSRGPGSTTVRFLDLTGGNKPGLLKKSSNGIGGQVEIAYRSSTQYYIKDRQAGEQWTTRLPFPIHCVERVTTRDVVAQTTYTMRYAYHNGYYDPFDRQFRGFQMVEEWDAEDLAGDSSSTRKFQRPPVHTKSWYYVGSEQIDADLVLPRCYHVDQPQQVPLSAAKISTENRPPVAAEVQDAYRALAGQQRRQEIFSADGSSKYSLPYLIHQQTYEVMMHQGIPRGQRYGIFRVNHREELSCHYERDLSEASIRHSLTLQTDQYGNVCKQVVVSYGKLASELDDSEDQKKQKETVITYQETSYTTPIDPLSLPSCDARDYFQIPLLSEICHYRVLPGSKWLCRAPGRYSWETLSTWLPGIHKIPLEETPTGDSEEGIAVLLSKSCTLYSKKDLTGPLQIHQFEPFSVEYQSYQLAFNNKLLEAILKDGESPLLSMRDLAKELSRGSYVQLLDVDGQKDEWWAPSTRMLYKDKIDDDSPNSSLGAARSHFYIPNAAVDQLGNISHQEFDEYKLLAVTSIDAAKNTTSFENSYVHLKPTLFTNANGNRTQAAFDPCGRGVGIAVMGKKTEALGDNLDGFLVEPSQELLQQFIADPSGPAAAQLLGNAGRRLVYYDCLQWDTTQTPQKILPSFHAELVRDTHYRDENGKVTVPQIAVNIVYFDGHGEAIQQVSISGNDKDTEKWRFSGWVIRDNKRQPVKQFLPFMDTTHAFRPQKDSSLAPATTLLRDPLDRVVAVVNPDHTWTKTRFDTWKHVVYDEGDTVTIDDPEKDEDVGAYFDMLERDSYLPTWYNSEKTSREAASKSRVYQNTPTISHMDALGRQIVIELDNGLLADGKSKDKRLMRKDYDLRGNVEQLRDSLKRVVSVIRYDLLGRPLFSINMDSGSRWNLPNCQGSPMLSWTGRGNRQRISYDKLGRVESIKIQPSRSSQEVTVVKNIYGEGRIDATQNNLKGELYQCYDQSGLWTNDGFDFHGNCVKLSAKYAVEYKQTLDWSTDTHALEVVEYATETSFNAIGLVVETKDFSKEKFLRTYDVAGRIKTLKSLADDEKTVTSSVDNVQYSADDKITSVTYGNGSTTMHEYDARTRKLARTVTNRTKDKTTLEDILYMYDCVGKIVKRTDSAQQTVYFNNQIVAPTQEYSYNALGKLVEATGREQVDLSNGGQKRLRPYDVTSVRNNSIPGDGRQVVEYIETYEYDLGGNILKMKHAARTAKDYSSWTRTYSYEELSSIPPQDNGIVVKSNRLSSTSVGGVTEAYQYDDDAGRNGCMTCIPGYSALAWDYNDKMRSFSTQKTSKPGVTPEMTWYVYNAQGERVRKVSDRASSNNGNSSGARSKDTRYLPMRDIFTTYHGDGYSVSNQITTTTVGDPSLSGTPIAMLEHNANTEEKVVRYQTSEKFELDGNAQVISHDEYSPYGASTYHSRIKGIPRKYRFMSYQKDKESGLYICGARYYAPWLGRWTSPDPMGTGDGLNLYAYVSNDPINFDDPQGTTGNQRQGPNLGRRDSLSGTVDLTSRIPIAEARNIVRSPTVRPGHASSEHGFNRSNSAPSLSESASAGPLWVISPGAIHRSISLPRFDIKTDGFHFANKRTRQRTRDKFAKESSKYAYDEAHNVYNFTENLEKARKNKEETQRRVDEKPNSVKLVKPMQDALRKYERVIAETNKAGEPVYQEATGGSKSFLKLVWEALEDPTNSKARSKFDLRYRDSLHGSGARSDGMKGDDSNHYSLLLQSKGTFEVIGDIHLYPGGEANYYPHTLARPNGNIPLPRTRRSPSI